MEIKPRVITVSDDNHRYKKREGIRNKDVIFKALLISALLLAVIVLAIKVSL